MLHLLPVVLITSAISGALGMGGGLVFMAVLSMTLAPSVAVPVHGVVQFVSNVSRVAAFRNAVVFSVVLAFVPTSLVGLWIARSMYQGLKFAWFKAAIGILIVLFLVLRRFVRTPRTFPLWVYAALGAVVGVAAIFVGATGPLIAPFFLRSDFSKEQIIATKAACQTWLHVMKLPVFLSLGFDYTPHIPLLVGLSIAAIAGTWVGKRILSRLPRALFIKLFEGLLALVAIYLISTGLQSLH